MQPSSFNPSSATDFVSHPRLLLLTLLALLSPFRFWAHLSQDCFLTCNSKPKFTPVLSWPPKVLCSLSLPTHPPHPPLFLVWVNCTFWKQNIKIPANGNDFHMISREFCEKFAFPWVSRKATEDHCWQLIRWCFSFIPSNPGRISLTLSAKQGESSSCS